MSAQPVHHRGDLSITQLAIPPLPYLPEWSPDRQIAVFLTLWNATPDVHVFSSPAKSTRKQWFMHWVVW